MSVGLWALSAFVFGVDAWRAFIDGFANGGAATHATLLHRDMLTVQQSIGKLGGDIAARNLGQALVIVAGGATVWCAARRLRPEAAIGLTLLVSALASPSLWVYDWPLVAVGLFMLTVARSPWPPLAQVLFGALWVAPLISLGAATMASSLAAPAILALSIIAAWMMLAYEHDAAQSESPHLV